MTPSKFFRLSLALLCGTIICGSSAVFAAKPGKVKATDADPSADASDAKPAKRGAKSDADIAARQLDRLRERLAVTDDAEWAVISERITKVETLRRALRDPGRGALAADGGKRVKRTSDSANVELDSLRDAIRDQYPDAELKARLARAHDMRERRQADLQSAERDLRAVLTVRQEAIAVTAGLLPP